MFLPHCGSLGGVLQFVQRGHVCSTVRASYRAEQLVPHLSRAPRLRLRVDFFSDRHPLVGHRGRPTGGEELIS